MGSYPRRGVVKSQKSCDSKVGLEIGTYPRAHKRFSSHPAKAPADNPDAIKF